mmetsp:Transcript_23048/g.48206  ORF Transcript_23048/g.48206 Transcript_23048/m.48206 type:complete len:244 (-) Transcript_23048:674-1405(-)
MTVGATHPRSEEAHPRGPNESRRLFRRIHEIIRVNYSDDVLELRRPVLSRRTVPVEMLGLFQDANVALILGNQPNQIPHTIKRILQHLLPRRIPLNPQLHTRPLHLRRLPQPISNVLLLILLPLEPTFLPSVNLLLILGAFHPRQYDGNASPGLVPSRGEVGGAQEGIDGRARHPREGAGGDDPYVFGEVGDVRVGEDGVGGRDGTGFGYGGEGFVECREGYGEGWGGTRGLVVFVVSVVAFE